MQQKQPIFCTDNLLLFSVKYFEISAHSCGIYIYIVNNLAKQAHNITPISHHTNALISNESKCSDISLPTFFQAFAIPCFATVSRKSGKGIVSNYSSVSYSGNRSARNRQFCC